MLVTPRGHTQAGNRRLPNSFDGYHGKSVRVRWGEEREEVGVWGEEESEFGK